jgi:hypothetical protein
VDDVYLLRVMKKSTQGKSLPGVDFFFLKMNQIAEVQIQLGDRQRQKSKRGADL